MLKNISRPQKVIPEMQPAYTNPFFVSWIWSPGADAGHLLIDSVPELTSATHGEWWKQSGRYGYNDDHNIIAYIRYTVENDIATAENIQSDWSPKSNKEKNIRRKLVPWLIDQWLLGVEALGYSEARILTSAGVREYQGEYALSKENAYNLQAIGWYDTWPKKFGMLPPKNESGFLRKICHDPECNTCNGYHQTEPIYHYIPLKKRESYFKDKQYLLKISDIEVEDRYDWDAFCRPLNELIQDISYNIMDVACIIIDVYEKEVSDLENKTYIQIKQEIETKTISSYTIYPLQNLISNIRTVRHKKHFQNNIEISF